MAAIDNITSHSRERGVQKKGMQGGGGAGPGAILKSAPGRGAVLLLFRLLLTYRSNEDRVGTNQMINVGINTESRE